MDPVRWLVASSDASGKSTYITSSGVQSRQENRVVLIDSRSLPAATD